MKISPFTLLRYFEKPGHCKVHLKDIYFRSFPVQNYPAVALLVIIREAGTMHKHFDANADHVNEQDAVEGGGDPGGRTGGRSRHRAEVRGRAGACRPCGARPQGKLVRAIKACWCPQPLPPTLPQPPASPGSGLWEHWLWSDLFAMGCSRGQGGGRGDLELGQHQGRDKVQGPVASGGSWCLRLPLRSTPRHHTLTARSLRSLPLSQPRSFVKNFINISTKPCLYCSCLFLNDPNIFMYVGSIMSLYLCLDSQCWIPKEFCFGASIGINS